MQRRRFRYTKAEIERVIANLLVDEEQLGKWSSPKGVLPRKKDTTILNLNSDEGWVVRHLAKGVNKTVTEMIKWLIIHYYFNKFISQDMLLKAENYVPVKTRVWLYGFAVRQIKKTDPKEPVKKKYITKKMLST